MPAVALVVVKAFAAMGIAVSRQGIFWLKHHKPDEYRDVHEHKHTGELKSSETLRLEFLAEVKALMNEGLLSEAEFAQMKTINGKSGNGHG
jgi:hypothetical protein